MGYRQVQFAIPVEIPHCNGCRLRSRSGKSNRSLEIVGSEIQPHLNHVPPVHRTGEVQSAIIVEISDAETRCWIAHRNPDRFPESAITSSKKQRDLIAIRPGVLSRHSIHNEVK